MRKRLILGLFLLLLLGVGVLVSWGQSRLRSAELYYSGTIETTQSNLAFQVSGRVQEVLTDEGRMAQKGEVLAALDRREFAALRDQAQANLQRADMTGADLSGSNLTSADLAGTKLTGANLAQATLLAARLDEQTQVDPKWRLVWEIATQGAAGRDFHNFNTHFRNNATYEVIAFTSAQISELDATAGIEKRIYPPELAGKRYPNGIPIYPESQLEKLVEDLDAVRDELARTADRDRLLELISSVEALDARLGRGLRALAQAITLGDMTMFLSVFRQSQGSVQQLLDSFNRVYENNLYLDNLIDYLKINPVLALPENGKIAPAPIQKGIHFIDVSFKYPGSEKMVLQNINLFIPPGESIALVGLNGAGKTTLIKLLTRLYDPTKGQILLDGVDLRDYDLKSLHQQFGVIFQDYVRYQFSVRENIGFGQVDAVDDALDKTVGVLADPAVDCLRRFGRAEVECRNVYVVRYRGQEIVNLHFVFEILEVPVFREFVLFGEFRVQR